MLAMQSSTCTALLWLLRPCPHMPGLLGAMEPDPSLALVGGQSQVCLHFARKLLRQQRLWALADFLPAWAAACPPELPPSQDMLRGEALVEGAASSSAGGSSRRGSEDGAAGVAKVRHFPASALPRDPAARFAALFAARGRWVRADLEPYLAGMCVPGCTAESLLLKYARASQRTPAEPMEFSARG